MRIIELKKVLDLKDTLRDLLHAFEKEILRANACNQCYFDMKYKNDRNGEWEKVYKIAPAFFALAIKGLQTETFMTISKLYENKRSDYNLNKLICFIESNSKRICMGKYEKINAEVKKYREALAEKQQTASKILHIRDKIIAHNDKEYFTVFDGKASDINLSFEEVVDLLKFAEELVNTFNCIIFQSRTIMIYNNGWVGNGHDVDQLMTFCLKNLHI